MRLMLTLTAFMYQWVLMMHGEKGIAAFVFYTF
jgi:hypothetical protein